jgi:AGZA family xanthine/uracil permease-like MFS transporter
LQTAVAAIGLLITVVLFTWRVLGALIIGIVITTAIALAWKVASLLNELWAMPDFCVAFKANIPAAVRWELLPLLFALIMVDFVDTLGTATAVAEEGDLMLESGHIPGLRRLLAVDSISASICGLLGVSSVTSYIESAAGVAEGARTGLHSVFVGALFLLAIFLAPLAAVVPPAATAPALVLVGFLMMKQVAGVDFERRDGAVPAFVTLLTIPMTYSIAHGIGYGFVAYVVVKVFTARCREVHVLMYAVAAAFATYFIWAPQ